MKAKLSLTILTALLAAAILVGCTQGRSDAAIAGDVQGKINADSGVATKQVTVQSANGVITLSGAVASDAERAAAANDAAQVAGVKTVINNLTVGTQSAQAQPPADAAPAQQDRRLSRPGRNRLRQRARRVMTRLPHCGIAAAAAACLRTTRPQPRPAPHRHRLQARLRRCRARRTVRT
jgi:Predicted periplasmic or secreted lipoprotein